MLSVVYAAVLIAVVVLVISLTPPESELPALTFDDDEIALIEAADSTMRVLTVVDSVDLAVLRTVCEPLSRSDIASEYYSRLAELMVATVTSPEQDGVGIAASQVGLSRRVVAVQRFDKEGEPFEVYANAQIDSLYGEQVCGPEGCLSIPGLRGNVLRYPNVIISYTDPDSLTEVSDTVSGFTAVIFQHEIDHLAGVLYTDRTDDITPDSLVEE